jgi:small basic protein
MKSKIQNILGLLLGIIIGSIINMSIVTISGNLIPLPLGVNPEDVNSLRENTHLFESKHYIMPFLAHALGTFSGAFIASKIAVSKKKMYAYIVGLFFLIGGISAAYMIGTPILPTTIDLVLAYLPMAWIAHRFTHG